MIPREAENTLRQLATGYPVLAITGPRQAGKTTLARAMFDQHPYVSMENPAEREFFDSDPRGFLDRYRDGAVVDEAQLTPNLFAWLQGVVDESRQPGQFVLTGSQQFGLLSGITQSLAGRVAMLNLLPFTARELADVGLLAASLDDALITGSYPPIFDRHLDPGIWYSNYVQTYVERDVRQLINVRDLTQFHRFLRLCAGRTGQLLNLSGLGADAGVSHNTVREWVSVLEASFIIHRLPPYHRNFNKRLVKTPKLYFVDTGLACWLLGIADTSQLSHHPLRGALFETWVVGEFLKRRLNAGLQSNLSFWRDRAGNEIDLLIEEAGTPLPIEIKSGVTVSRDAQRALDKWRDTTGETSHRPRIVYGGAERQRRTSLDVVPWNDIE